MAVLQGIDLWSQRAELAAIHEELPWTDLLGGILSPDDILDRDKVQLVDYLRGKGLKLYFMADLTDGLSRGEEAPQLRALGRSITELDVQWAYRDYMLAVERKLHPEFIGLAAETNLIRVAAPSAVYAAVVTAIDLASIPPPIPSNLPLFVNIGLTDSDFNAKPALAAWDALHARRLIP